MLKLQKSPNTSVYDLPTLASEKLPPPTTAPTQGRIHFIVLSKRTFFSVLAFLILTVSLVSLSPTFLSLYNSHSHRHGHSLTISSTYPPNATVVVVGNHVVKAKIRIGTWNLKFDPLAATTIPVGQDGDGSEYKPNADYNTQISGLRVNERPWAERRWRIADSIFNSAYDIIGFQEALVTQVTDMQSLLGSSWSHFGVGRNDGGQKGEFSPIFYDSTRFTLLNSTTRWLSTTPTVAGSISWDASQTRIVTLVTLEDKQSSAILHLGNTHWDDQGVTAREMSGRLLRTLLPDYAKQVEKQLGLGDGKNLVGNVLLMGDLNSPAEEQGYQALTNVTLTASSLDANASLTSPAFHDTLRILPRRAASPSNMTTQLPLLPYGPYLTWTSFNPTSSVVQTRIDFVFLYDRSWLGSNDATTSSATNATSLTVSRFGVGSNYNEGDLYGWKGYLTDHRPVLVELLVV
ncbi:Endonuclease/exonuclease/phosphatase [Phaffia rhodozyma]|uniref:Endonuclease/exonuclease/phosphatase n=1 Tax=Phaffia rhodozyma TaxID=264483 RepID=A0A0F7STJ5_PHARH|nr:Endonuclease/exonuclease/phosphatase [Phaffia rhodozyma]